jgi:RNA polymerase subunit RPABC4/transcription elongation factor Spt4
MGELVDRAAAAIGDVLGHPIVQTTLQLTVAYAVIVWLASAFWASQDIRQRTPLAIAPYVVAGAIILASPVFFLLALGVYRIVRPGETLTEMAERRLSELAIAQELDRPTCESCGARIDDEWVACPRCASTLRTGCERCGRLVEFAWTICPWCATERGPAGRSPAGIDGDDVVAIPLGAARARRSAGARA